MSPPFSQSPLYHSVWPSTHSLITETTNVDGHNGKYTHTHDLYLEVLASGSYDDKPACYVLGRQIGEYAMDMFQGAVNLTLTRSADCMDIVRFQCSVGKAQDLLHFPHHISVNLGLNNKTSTVPAESSPCVPFKEKSANKTNYIPLDLFPLLLAFEMTGLLLSGFQTSIL